MRSPLLAVSLFSLCVLGVLATADCCLGQFGGVASPKSRREAAARAAEARRNPLQNRQDPFGRAATNGNRSTAPQRGVGNGFGKPIGQNAPFGQNPGANRAGFGKGKAPFGQQAAPAAKSGQQTHRWQVGMIIQARSGPCAGIYATAAVPSDWPEQQVKLADEQISTHVKRWRFRTLKGGVKQMIVEIPRLPGGQTATALLTFEVTKRAVSAPTEPEKLVVPRKIPRGVSVFLGSSPFIESRQAQIRNKSRMLVASKSNDWSRAKAIFDFVRTMEYREGKLKGATATMRDGYGQKEDLTCLFIALCRAAKIPARTVWIPDHNYAEFYMEDGEGKPHWLPCELSGQPSFGYSNDLRPILQRGDRFTVPEKREPQRLVAEFLKSKGKPTVTFVRKLLPTAN